ncbi:hypothetical protein KKE60_07200 [Patescibacteria group bacterium]|nr:hypothetical protein [Patescibacteria group bacterium]
MDEVVVNHGITDLEEERCIIVTFNRFGERGKTFFETLLPEEKEALIETLRNSKGFLICEKNLSNDELDDLILQALKAIRTNLSLPFETKIEVPIEEY